MKTIITAQIDPSTGAVLNTKVNTTDKQEATPPVFFITVFTQPYLDWLGGDKNVDKKMSDSRCWGFYFKYENAHTAVLRNATDLQECYYKWAVIEEYHEGVLSFGEVRQWFVWEGNNSMHDEPGHWTPTDTPPKGSEQIVSFAIG